MSKELINFHATDKIIGCAIAVHKSIGSGFLEKFYEEALCIELADKGLAFSRQVAVPVSYRQKPIGLHRLDLIVEDKVLIELKAVKKIEEIHYATTLSYLKASKLPVGLLLNFNAPSLVIKRFANTIFSLPSAATKDRTAEESARVFEPHIS